MASKHCIQGYYQTSLGIDEVVSDLVAGLQARIISTMLEEHNTVVATSLSIDKPGNMDRTFVSLFVNSEDAISMDSLRFVCSSSIDAELASMDQDLANQIRGAFTHQGDCPLGITY